MAYTSTTPNGAGDGCDLVDQIFVGIDDHDGGMTHASVVGGGDEILHLRFRELVNLFQKELHFRRGGVAHDEGDRLAVGPAVGLAFADLHEVGHGDGGYGIGLVGDEREIARGCQRNCWPREIDRCLEFYGRTRAVSRKAESALQ